MRKKKNQRRKRRWFFCCGETEGVSDGPIVMVCSAGLLSLAQEKVGKECAKEREIEIPSP